MPSRRPGWRSRSRFDPGVRWHYSPSIDWVGRLIVETSGKPLGAYMQENIFEPLGMASTGYAVTPDMAARQATIHQRAEDGSIAVADLPPQEGPVREIGGGGLKGTTPDYLRFIRMILNGGSGNGNQLLKPETVADMAKNHMGDIRVQLLETTDPSRSLDAEFFPGVPKSWGLTFMINEEQAPTGRPAGGLAWAGALQHLLLDRPDEPGRRGVHEPAAAVRRHQDDPGLLPTSSSPTTAPRRRDAARPGASGAPGLSLWDDRSATKV